MIVIGMDADSYRLAYATADGSGVRAVATLERANRIGRVCERYDAGLTSLMRTAADFGACVYLEDVYLATAGNTARNVQGFKTLAIVQGEIRREARRCGVPVELVSASKWHAAILGFTRNRDKLKAAAQAKAMELTGRDTLTEHEADAVCLALFGLERETAATGAAV